MGVPTAIHGNADLGRAPLWGESSYWATTPHAMRPPAFPAGSLV